MRKCEGVFWLTQRIFPRRIWREQGSEDDFRMWSWKAVWRRSGNISGAGTLNILSDYLTEA